MSYESSQRLGRFDHTVNLQRRKLLRGLAAAGAGGATLGALSQFAAMAQDPAEDYRALVCIFMFGGNDSNNLLVPTDTATYAKYAARRPNLALGINQLLPIAGNNADGHTYGLHPSFTNIQSLYNQGKAAVIANAGTLLAPASQINWSNGLNVPSNLFSHSDQQSQWQSAISDGTGRNGWGGRMLERLLDTSVANRGYGAISVTGGNLWEASDGSLVPYKVSSAGNFGFDFYDPTQPNASPLSNAIHGTLTEARPHLFEQAWLDVMGRSIETQRVLATALKNNAISTVFPDTELGRQLRTAALLVSARNALGLKRQCIFCSIGGFDTHGDDQLYRQQSNFAEIDAAVSAFYQAMVDMDKGKTASDPTYDLAKRVTLFTASDFSRTLVSNGQGTDHAWGGHHLVVGGSVQGNKLYGTFPNLTINGPDDTGDGRWIPTTAVTQIGSTLGKWFGASDAQLDEVFPRLANFNRDLGFMG